MMENPFLSSPSVTVRGARFWYWVPFGKRYRLYQAIGPGNQEGPFSSVSPSVQAWWGTAREAAAALQKRLGAL